MTNDTNDITTEPAAPKRRSRRATRPVMTPQDGPAEQPVEQVAPVEEIAAEAAAEIDEETTAEETEAEQTEAVEAEPAPAPVPEKAPAKRARRSTRSAAPATAEQPELSAAEPVAAEPEPAAETKPARRRATTKKVAEQPAAEDTPAEAAPAAETPEAPAAEEKPKRRRATRKAAEPTLDIELPFGDVEPEAVEAPAEEPVAKAPAKRSRSRKAAPAAETEVAEAPAEQPSAEQPAAEEVAAPRTRGRRATRPVREAEPLDVLAELGRGETKPAAGRAAAAALEDIVVPTREGGEESPRLPATALLFQAPDITPRRRKKAAAPAVAAEAETATEEVLEREAEVAAETPAPAGRRRRRAGRPQGAAEVAEVVEEENVVEAAPDESVDEAEHDEDENGEDKPRRRRRRGGRGRRKTGGSADADTDSEGEADAVEPEDAEESGDDEAETENGAEDGEGGSRRRRRRSRTSRTTRTADDGARAARDAVTPLKGSTRLEAKRQRRREGRDAQRRRSIITEAEFLARRESVDRSMIVRESGGRTQVAVLEDNVLVEHYVARKQQTSMVGNVYLGRVQNVLPSMEAAFVDLGRGRNAVLYAGEVNWDAAGLEGQPRRIEQALSSGDSVLVQVTKDPIGHKGARLTSQVTLAGRYLVLVPSGSMTGISRKLPDTERARLKKLLKDIVPEGQGVIVRTAAEGASEEELRRDVERLTAQWAEIEKKSVKPSNAPVLLKGEPELAVRVVRDVFNEDFTSLTVSGAEAWTTVSEYVNGVAPDLAGRLHHWVENKDVFAAHRIDEQLAKGMDRKVWLPSGGSLVIDRTEAMTVVDVNTGKFTGSGGTLEETVTKNNLEAAEEIVRQLRLRDIGGIIVIDFIDMVLESNRDLVLRRLVECLGRDRTRHQVAEVTSLGLVQMTRKRVGQGLVEAFSETCECCHGRGFLVHNEPVETPAKEIEAPAEEAPTRARRSRGRKPVAQEVQVEATAPAEPAAEDPQRAQVKATLAAIAAAAQHAHDAEGTPEGEGAPAQD